MKHKNLRTKLWVFALAVCFMLTSFPLAAFATDAEAEVETEEFAIPEGAIYLSDADDLLELAENCVSDVWSRDKVFVLENDIDLGGVAFSSIPTFGGTFLGLGHTISGLHLTGEVTALGFFRYLQKTAVVDDLHLEGVVRPSKSGNLDIGGMVGINSGTVKNCSFTGTVSGTERIGGIAGRNKVSGIIEGCRVSGIVYGDHYIGGVTGENAGVIRDCVNYAEVNTHVDHNSVSVGMVSGLSLESLTARESISDATNMGGISGTSSGVIRGCENQASIGYEKMGYNVGGIAGSQIGYITECINSGIVNGSNGVGGIVGQFKPNVVLEMGENYMSNLMDQMTGLMGSMQGMIGSMQGMLGNMSFDHVSMQESMDLLKNPENWNPDSINAAVNEMSYSFNSMYQNMVASGSHMTDQMNSMMGSMGGMMKTMEKLNEGLNIKIIDVSREDTPGNTLTKVSNCTNYGTVHGETYVGGITGIADIEDTTAKDDVEAKLNFSTEGEMIMRLVIRDCRNLATVSASKQYAGGIVGNMTIGAVFGGMNTGSIDALNADYVGGIAGSSETYLVDSFSRCILAGSQYVGGIAGFGTEVEGCYSIADIAAATKFAGGILGYTDPLPDEETGLVLDNHYYLSGRNLGGIDGISYEGATAPITIREFLAAEGLDDMFRTVTLRFLAEDREDMVLTVPLGTTIGVAKAPQLDVGENELYHWVLCSGVSSETLGMGEIPEPQYLSRERLTNILFDQTYEAVFDAKNMVVASSNKTESGRSLALAVGAFDQETTLKLTNITKQEPAVGGVAVLENWQVKMADIGVEKLHYHIPDGVDAENIVLYVKDISGNWVQRDFTMEGSYMIFPFTHGESGFALEVLPAKSLPVVPIAITAGVIALVLLAMGIYKKRKNQKAEPARNRKKWLPIILSILGIAILVGGIILGSGVIPTANHAVRISELLQPMLEAENQMMHMTVSAQIGDEPVSLESDIFLVTEDGIPYAVVAQNGTSVYVADNILFLENGKAFRIGEEMQSPTVSYGDLLPQTKAMYDALKITADKTEEQTTYAVSVNGEQAASLLAAASLGEALPAGGVQTLNLELTEKSGQLDQITFSGNGNLEGTAVTLDVTLSAFRILASGDCPVPDAVKQSLATVNPEELFSLSEDLYRLLPALKPFAHMDAIDGSLELTVDSELLQLNTRMKLSDLTSATNEQIDPEKLQALPEALAELCMEGDIRCEPKGSAYVYTLSLDRASMQKLSRMILPELAGYGGNLTEGSATLLLDAGKITSMNVSIEGKINALITQIPISVGAEFTFEDMQS